MFLDIVTLSLTVSLSASVVAAAVGLPLGAALAMFEFRGRHLLILIANALLGLPPVVVGLALYLLLSRSGPLGSIRPAWRDDGKLGRFRTRHLRGGRDLDRGGNIAGYTRTLTTAITLETSEGNFAFALALGAVLIAISVAVSTSAFGIEAWLMRKTSSKDTA